MKLVLIEKMTSLEFNEASRTATALIMPLASVEVLGAHGPLGADLLVANAVSPLIAEASNCLVAPAIPYGDTLELSFWAGTVHIPQNTLADFYLSVANSFFERSQLKAIVFLAFHSLNIRAADQACRALKHEGRNVMIVDWWKAAGSCCKELISDQQNGFGHGAELITSVTAAVAPDSVDLTHTQGEEPKAALTYYGKHLPQSGNAYAAYGDFRDYCKGGAWGSLSAASADKGKQIISRTIPAIAAFIHENAGH